VLSGVQELKEPYRGTGVHRARLRQMTSLLVSRYVKNIQLAKRAPRTQDVVVDATSQREIAMLKELVWVYVIHNPALATQQVGQREVIRSLFERFYRAAVRDTNGRSSRSRTVNSLRRRERPAARKRSAGASLPI
jgi:dGTPase